MNLYEVGAQVKANLHGLRQRAHLRNRSTCSRQASKQPQRRHKRMVYLTDYFAGSFLFVLECCYLLRDEQARKRAGRQLRELVPIFYAAHDFALVSWQTPSIHNQLRFLYAEVFAWFF